MAETTGLLNRRTPQAYHEFESRPLRPNVALRYLGAIFCAICGSAGDVPFPWTSPANKADYDGIVPVFGTLPALKTLAIKFQFIEAFSQARN